jgi:amino acid adenylation domain-containing protein/thioester reductase-like protein
MLNTKSNQSNQIIHKLVEQQVLQTPTAIAVTFQGKQLTYQELNQKANQLAHYLQSLGVKSETLVGVCIERSLDMLVALLAVLKAGGAYVPLDPSYPTDRIAFMLEDSELPILLTEQAQLANLPQSVARVVVLEADRLEIDRQDLDNVISAVTADSLAYTIYTSGSTGKPKGVQVLHGGVVNFLESMLAAPGLTAADTLLAVTTISFDIAVLELFLPLIAGAKIELVGRDVAADGMRLAEAIATSGTTLIQATPATWRLLLATGWQGNNQLKILSGGEVMIRSLADRLMECCGSLWNMYGPTETTIWSAVYQVQPGSDAVSIGYPIANTQIYIIDQRCRRKDDVLSKMPIGQAGELHIGGDGLARGYLNRVEMTEQRFVPDPFSSKPNARLYKTGDLARIMPDGSIQFIGRVDNQVKIRGHRIELGDIEATICQYPEIQEAAVITREDNVGEKQLVAYLVAANSQNLYSNLRAYLKEKLPEYMVPAIFMMMDKFPLTPNGKVDRRALPAPSQDRPELDVEMVEPTNDIERDLAQIWSQMLGIVPIGIHDNFFDLGGHSLFIAQMMTQVAETFAVKLPLSELFIAPTVAGLAQSIVTARQPQALADQLKFAQLRADAELDASIVPEVPSVVGGASPLENGDRIPQNILLTGATGFLGAFLLDELLRSTTANIYCLVRCSSLKVGSQKLQRNLARYALIEAAQNPRVITLQGDLAEPLFGMTASEFRQLAGQIDLIYHNGAYVNLVYPYAAMREINVLGTQEILRLASQIKVKPVHFVSTLDVFQSTYHSQLSKLAEDDDFPETELPGSGYAQTKWVAEKLVKAANDRGIPTCIHRPGMIVGHSQTGYSNTEDTIGRLIKGLIQLRIAPTLDLPMHLTPVDYVSQAMVKLASQPQAWGKAFHYSNPHSLSLAELVDYIRSLNYEIQDLDYDRWLKALIDLDATQDNALKPLIPILSTGNVAYSKYLEVLNLGNVSRQNVADGLVETTISCPELNGDLLSTYFDYLIDSGFLDGVASTLWNRPQPSTLSLSELLKASLPQSDPELLVMN